MLIDLHADKRYTVHSSCLGFFLIIEMFLGFEMLLSWFFSLLFKMICLICLKVTSEFAFPLYTYYGWYILLYYVHVYHTILYVFKITYYTTYIHIWVVGISVELCWKPCKLQILCYDSWHFESRVQKSFASCLCRIGIYFFPQYIRIYINIYI